MTILPAIYQTSLAFAAVLACMGFGLFFLRRVTSG